MFKIKNFFRDIYYGIENLIIWFSIIWNDRQWDHNFLLYILEKKLKLMEDYFEEGGIIVDSKAVAKRIRIARILIKRLKNDDYGIYDGETLRDWKHAKMLREQDKEYFGKIIKKYIDTWWD